MSNIFGKTSSSMRTWHLIVLYFFVTDKIQKGEVNVAFCPTTNMLADFFHNPLQGSIFRKMCNTIHNLPDSKKINECVGEKCNNEKNNASRKWAKCLNKHISQKGKRETNQNIKGCQFTLVHQIFLDFLFSFLLMCG